MALLEHLKTQNSVIIRQRKEWLELAGFETRNKYEILDHQGQRIGFCAEQEKGFWGSIMRMFFGHWRRFTLHFFDVQRNEIFYVKHPYRFFMQRLEVSSPDRKLLGAVQQRFSIVRKKFDLVDAQGRTLLRMNSGFFKIWTFPLFRGSTEVASIQKKWSGALKEFFTDADNFLIEFKSPSLTELEKYLILASGIFVDLQYFEVTVNRH